MYKSFSEIGQQQSLFSENLRYQRKVLRDAYGQPLDRVNVLGDDSGDYGHTGCVNALSWALNGDVLITGGDDRTVRLWRLDQSDSDAPYPFKCDTVINTGHTGNIFNAQLLPHSSLIATVARDGQVRVFDAETALTTRNLGKETPYDTGQTCIRIFKCHSDCTKRVVIEDSSDLFLTVSEDGSVRQHDLRTPHNCAAHAECPPPLVQLPHELSSLAMSPLTPYQFVVGGRAPHGYLFDRRKAGRVLQAEWGVPGDSDAYVTCVRRFGRPCRGPEERRGTDHVTGVRMARGNGHDVLLYYAADGVYLYSTRDEPESAAHQESSVLTPNRKQILSATRSHRSAAPLLPTSSDDNGDEEQDTSPPSEDEDDQGSEQKLEANGHSEDEFGLRLETRLKAPVILPRRRFAGPCHVQTVKDVNFVGPDDEYVAAGSDDGNFFLWEAQSGKLHAIYEGDDSIVNVVEGHPRLPLIATSGIDTTVKLFAPTTGHSDFSRTHNAEEIISSNLSSARAEHRGSAALARLYLHYQLSLREETGEEGEPQCTFQ